MPKILLLDIETSPNQAFVWKIWKENIGTDQLIQSSRVLSWSAKWIGTKEIMFDAEWKSGERKMLSRIHTLLDEADIVIHYNGQSFDIPTLNKEFVKHNFQPPAPYRQIDLLLVAKENFRFVSNKLDYVCQFLGLGQKVRHPGFMLWVNTMAGDKKAQAVMERYNIHDVRILERLYVRLLPWIRNHPNVGVFTDASVCPNCGGKHIQRRGFATTRLMKYPRFQCQTCSAWFRGTKSVSQPRKERYTGIGA